jgi:hypothetical protein
VFWRVNALRLPAWTRFPATSSMSRKALAGGGACLVDSRLLRHFVPLGPRLGDLTPKSALLFHGRPGAGDQASPRYTGTLISFAVISGCVPRRIPGRETCRAPYQHQAVNEPKVPRTARQFSAAGLFVRERFADSSVPAARKSP